MATWGSYTIRVQAFAIPNAALSRSKKPTLARPGDTGPSRIIMDGGRQGRESTVSGWCSPQVFQIMQADYEGAYSRTLVLPDGSSMEALIDSLKGELKIGARKRVWFEATFAESGRQTGNGTVVVIETGEVTSGAIEAGTAEIVTITPIEAPVAL